MPPPDERHDFKGPKPGARANQHVVAALYVAPLQKAAKRLTKSLEILQDSTSTRSYHGVLGGPIAIIGTAAYDGQGNFTGGREAASRNGEIEDWTDLPPGSTYTVDPDCTGSAVDVNGNKTANLVVTDSGNGFLLISTLTSRTITATGKRLEHED
jgi:hypothetical protein